MCIPTSERIGIIAARLAMADEYFLQHMLKAAQDAGKTMLPDDMETLVIWARLMRALRSVHSDTPSEQ